MGLETDIRKLRAKGRKPLLVGSSGSLRIARNAFPGIGLLAKEQRRRVAASGKAGTIR